MTFTAGTPINYTWRLGSNNCGGQSEVVVVGKAPGIYLRAVGKKSARILLIKNGKQTEVTVLLDKLTKGEECLS